MNSFINSLLDLCIVPFKENTIFYVVAGLLSVSWLFRSVYRLTHGNY